MNRFFIFIATICGAVLLVSMLLLPIVSTTIGDNSRHTQAIEGGAPGTMALLLSGVAATFMALVFFRSTSLVAMAPERLVGLSFLCFKLVAIVLLAWLFEGNGSDKSGFGVGFWFSFLASLADAFALLLAGNPGLAQKLRDVAKADDAPPASNTPPASDA